MIDITELDVDDIVTEDEVRVFIREMNRFRNTIATAIGVDIDDITEIYCRDNDPDIYVDYLSYSNDPEDSHRYEGQEKFPAEWMTYSLSELCKSLCEKWGKEREERERKEREKEEEKRKKEEAAEKAEYERLKAKYENKAKPYHHGENEYLGD